MVIEHGLLISGNLFDENPRKLVEEHIIKLKGAIKCKKVHFILSDKNTAFQKIHMLKNQEKLGLLEKIEFSHFKELRLNKSPDFPLNQVVYIFELPYEFDIGDEPECRYCISVYTKTSELISKNEEDLVFVISLHEPAFSM